MSPTEDQEDDGQPPIEIPYYFHVADSMDATVNDFPLPGMYFLPNSFAFLLFVPVLFSFPPAQTNIELEQHPQVLGDFNRRFQEAVKV